MSKTTRRTFLKGLAYGSALSMSGLSGLAMAKSNTQTSGAALPTCDIHLLPTQRTGSEKLSLFNHTDSQVIIDGIDRVNLDGENRFLAVKVKKLGEQAGISGTTLAPGEFMEFVVAATSSDFQEDSAENGSLGIPNVLAGQLKVSSNHQAFDGMIPVTIFDSQAA